MRGECRDEVAIRGPSVEDVVLPLGRQPAEGVEKGQGVVGAQSQQGPQCRVPREGRAAGNRESGAFAHRTGDALDEVVDGCQGGERRVPGDRIVLRPSSAETHHQRAGRHLAAAGTGALVVPAQTGKAHAGSTPVKSD